MGQGDGTMDICASCGIDVDFVRQPDGVSHRTSHSVIHVRHILPDRQVYVLLEVATAVLEEQKTRMPSISSSCSAHRSYN